MDNTIGSLAKKYISTCFQKVIKSFNKLISSFLNTQTSHTMLVCGNDKISPHECDATILPSIDTIPIIPSKAYSIIDVYEPSNVPSIPSNSNFSPE